MHTINGYQFTLLPLESIDILKNDWVALEEVANNYFFLSWAWISTWIETYNPELKILRAYNNGELVAIAALVLAKERRYYFLNSQTFHVHQTGDPEKDQVWIEYNGLLVKHGHKDLVTSASIKYLIDFTNHQWDELVVGAITEHEASLLENAGNLMRHDLWDAPCYGVQLKKLRKSKTDYLSTLSRNTRYQINRSIRKYTKLGPLEVLTADTKSKALDYFKEIGPLHIKRWGSDPGESGYANRYFTLFHENLINEYWGKGVIELIRIRVNGNTIANFYNFIYRNRVYFYLSGLVAESDATLKPGLTGHALCIQKYIDEGLDFYDFMGGGERYKASLGKKHEHLVKLTLQKSKIKFIFERFGRKIKEQLTKEDKP